MSQATDATQASYHHGDLRRQLLDRAAEVIQEKGLEALSLRGLARDLGVSHGAPNRHFKSRADLLAALAADGYARLTAATLDAAEQAGTDPWLRLNAMGRGYLRWSLDNPASFHTIMHPDLRFYETDALRDAITQFQLTVREAVIAAQLDGRHQDAELDVLNLYTHAAPMGAAMLLSRPDYAEGLSIERDQDELISQLIELVVPVALGVR